MLHCRFYTSTQLFRSNETLTAMGGMGESIAKSDQSLLPRSLSLGKGCAAPQPRFLGRSTISSREGGHQDRTDDRRRTQALPTLRHRRQSEDAIRMRQLKVFPSRLILIACKELRVDACQLSFPKVSSRSGESHGGTKNRFSTPNI